MDLANALQTEQTTGATTTQQEGQTDEAKKAASVADAIEKSKAPDSASSRFAALAKKEKLAYKQMQEAKSQKAEFEAWKKSQEQELEQKAAKYNERESLFEKAKSNPIEALKALGWSYQDITKYMLNNQEHMTDREIKSVKEEIADLKRSHEEKEKKHLEDQKQRETEQFQEVLDNFKTEIGDFVEKNQADYEFIHRFNGQELVFATIEAHFEKTKEDGKPIVLSIKEASDLVEKYYEGEVDRLSETNKFKKKFNFQKEEGKGDPTKEDPKPGIQGASKTLNNNMVSSSSPSYIPAKNETDRMQRALAALSR